jgi:hypothetical protein
MNNIENKTLADISADLYIAIIECVKQLEKVTGRKIYKVTLNPHLQDREIIWGIAFSFNLKDEGYRVGK